VRSVFSAVERAAAVAVAFLGSFPSGEASKAVSTPTKTCACCTASALLPMRPAIVTMRDWAKGASGESGFSLMSRW
jgi:hypothetical protein